MRRVFAAEYRRALGGISDTWLRSMYARGVVQRPQYDPGGRRRWWTDEQLASDLAALAARSNTAPALSGVALKAHRASLARKQNAPASVDSVPADTARATTDATP